MPHLSLMSKGTPLFYLKMKTTESCSPIISLKALIFISTTQNAF